MKYRVKTDKLPVDKGTEIGAQHDCCAGIHYDTYECEWYANNKYLESNPDWFEEIEEFKEGDWVITTENINSDGSYYIYKADRITDWFVIGTGIANFMGRGQKWDNEINFEPDNVRHATKEEIEEHLIKEAKRRYSVGDNVQRPSTYNGACDPKEQKIISYLRFHYFEPEDRLVCDAPTQTVYEKGEWAEIIDKTPQIEINGYKAEFHDGYVKFGCTDVPNDDIIELNRMADKYEIILEIFGENYTREINELSEYVKKNN